ncbi:nSTAND1 domain-containing NTPase [Streptomyces rimosus]
MQQLMVRVRERPLPVPAGPSGSGEPSLLRAGLIPNLRTTSTARCSIRRRTTTKPGRCPAHGTSVQASRSVAGHSVITTPHRPWLRRSTSADRPCLPCRLLPPAGYR